MLRTCGGAGHSFRGVAIMISTKETQKTLVGWEQASQIIITSKFITTQKRISLNIIQCYAPTNDVDEDTKKVLSAT